MPTDQPSSVDEKDGVEESMLRLSDSEGDVRSIACGGLVQPAARRSSYSPQQTLPAPPPRLRDSWVFLVLFLRGRRPCELKAN